MTPPQPCYNTLNRNQPMRFSPATRLSTRETVWVSYRNDGTNFNRLTDPAGHPATIWSAQFEDAFRNDVRQAQWG